MASMGNMVAGGGMLIVETIAKGRRAYFIQQKPIKAICPELRLSRRVVRKVIRSEATEFHYERRQQPLPGLIRGATSSTVCCWRTRASRRASG
jgi:hypothetical protein